MQKRKESILIIDDDKSIVHIFTRILQKQGYDTDAAETGQEALERAQAHKYDLALIDVKLPDTNGTDLLTTMNKKYPNIVKIIITGFPSLEDVSKALHQGAAAYLVKPVRSEELISVIAEKLRKNKPKNGAILQNTDGSDLPSQNPQDRPKMIKI